ncbi:hypothetical protein [Streptomyces sp. NPDC094049]|uniref:hypothetical protein n=1 Tax=Streptomyces sp. NPDC094049 TaxID=3154987 RepID=UPI003333F0B5
MDPDFRERVETMDVREVGSVSSPGFKVKVMLAATLQAPRETVMFELPSREEIRKIIAKGSREEFREGFAEGFLNPLALLLPVRERAGWLEEQRGYLADLPTSGERWKWICSTILAVPRYAYTVRTGREKERA